MAVSGRWYSIQLFSESAANGNELSPIGECLGVPRLPAKNLILRTQRQPRSAGFQEAKPLQKPRKNETMMKTDNLKTAATKQAQGLPRSEGMSVAIKCQFRHYVSCPRVPRVVFPECQQTAWTQTLQDVTHRFIPFRDRDMMKNTIAIDQINRILGDIILELMKRAVRGGVLLARNFKAPAGNVASQH